MSKLELVVNRTGTDQDFFESKEAYEAYLKEEKSLRVELLDIGFDWRYFLRMIFKGE